MLVSASFILKKVRFIIEHSLSHLQFASVSAIKPKEHFKLSLVDCVPLLQKIYLRLLTVFTFYTGHTV